MRTVTVDGSHTSDGITSPCSLPRAVQLANANIIDQPFEIQPGKYTYPQLDLKSKGANFAFQSGAYLSGALAHAKGPWTQVSEHVWRMPYANPVNLVVQLGNWKPILVDDHGADGKSYGRPYTLVEPVKLKWANGVAQVTAQYGTWTQAEGDIYVHMYHSSEPHDDDLLYFGPKLWGTFVISGSENTVSGLTVRNTTGQGLYVKTTAKNNTLYDTKCVDAQVWLEGYQTVVNGLDVSHFIQQGAPGNAQCWNANDGFGECWNAFGDGRGLLIGRENTGYRYDQTITGAYVHRCWNGARVDGPNTITRSLMWGFANHTLEASGKDVEITNCVFMNGQDSLFASRQMAMGGWTIEDNVFHGGVYIVTDAKGTAPTEWQFNRNVVNTLTVDYKIHRTMKSQSNIRIDNENNAYRVIDTGAEKGFSQWEVPNQ